MWTGAYVSGQPTLYTCANWTSNAPGALGTVGNSSMVNSAFWSNNNAAQACSNNFPIYCVEQ